MRGRRRGSRHGRQGISQPHDPGQYPGHARAVVRARRRKLRSARSLSDAIGRVRGDPRPRDARRLVARNRHRRVADAWPPLAQPGGGGDRGAAGGKARADRGAARGRRDRRARRPRTPLSTTPWRRRCTPSSAARAPCSRAPSSTISSARRSPPTFPAPTASGQTGAIRIGDDVTSAFASARAQVVLAALASARR